MPANKAKKVETFYGKYSNTVVYEYRGRTYEVEYANGWNYCCTPASVQHRDAQEKIDNALDNRKDEGTANPFDMDEVWNILGW